jgi:hypothetical protein
MEPVVCSRIFYGVSSSIKYSRTFSRVSWSQEETDVSGTSVSSYNQQTRLIAQEDFFEFKTSNHTAYLLVINENVIFALW